MNMSARRVFSGILAFVLLIFMTGNCLYNIVDATSTNLLLNSDFEEFSNNEFTNWQLWPGNNGNTKLEQVDGRNGKAAKITVDNNNNTINLYQTVTLNPEYSYKFTAWIKTENIALQWDGANGVFLNLSYNNNLALVKSELIKADTDWKKVEFVVEGSVLQGDEWGVHFDIAAEFLTGFIYVDDVCLERIEESSDTDISDTEELLKNNRFEEYSNSSFTDWELWPGNHGRTTVSQADGRTGKAAKIDVKDYGSIVNLYQNITLDSDCEYIFTAWVKMENIVRQWDTAPGVHINLWCDNTIKVASDSINADTDWQKIEVVVDAGVLSGNETDIRFDVSLDYIKGVVYIDDASLKVKTDSTLPEDPIPTPPPAGDDDEEEDNKEEENHDPDEFLKNNGFEKYFGGSFENWNLWKGNNGNTKLEQVDGHTGKAAKITVDNNNNTVDLYQTVTLDPEKTYILSAWVKTENIALQWEGANGVYLTLSYNNNIPLTKSELTKTDSDWKKLELEVDGSVLKGDEWGVHFDIAAEYLTGNIYIDDVSLKVAKSDPIPDGPDPTPPPAGDEEEDNKKEEENQDSDELLKNKSFEKYSNGNFEGWNFWKGNQGNTKIKQVKGRTKKAAKITVDNNNNIVNLYQKVTLNPEKTYLLSAWIKTENLKLQWEGANGVYLALSYNNNISLAKSELIKTNSDWQKLELVVDGSILKGDEWGVNFDVFAEYLTGSIYVDDVSLKVTDRSLPEDTENEESTSNPDDNKNQNSDKLLINNSFEKYSNGNFEGWNLWKGNQGNTKLEQVKGRKGKAAKITVDNDNNTVNLYQPVTLNPKNRYKLTAWIKTENLKLQWEGANGVYLALSYNNNIPLAKSELIKTDSDWQKLELVVDGSILKGDEWGVNFDIFAEYLTGSIYVDDVSLKITNDVYDSVLTPETNSESDSNDLLKNKGFEKYSDGSFADWTLWPGNKGKTEIEQVKGRTGKAVKITVDNNQNIVNLYQEIKLDPTKEYTFSVWVKTKNIDLQWPGAQGVYLNLSCNNGKILMSESVNSDSDWQKLEVVVNGGVLTGEEWSVRFDIAAEYLTGEVFIDDANIKVTGKATPITKPDDDELLKNNSFEIYSAGNFANWTVWKGNKGNTTVEQVKGRTGKAAKITVDDNNNIVNLYQEVELEPSSEYTFSVWVKTEDIALQWPGAQGVYLNFKYNNNVVLMSKPVTIDSDWQKLEVVVNGGILKGDEWGVSLDVAGEFLTGSIYIDDASVKVTGKGSPVPEQSPDELLENSSFELYSGYNFARWNLNRGNNGNTQLEQVDGRTGKAAKITVDDNNNIVAFYQNITLDPTKEYTFSVWVKTEDIALQWEGAEGVYLGFGYNNTTPVRSKAIKTDSGWQKLEIVVGGGDLKGDEWGVMFAITAEFLTGTIYVDDASMKISGKYQPKATSFLQNGSFDTPDDDTIIKDWTAFAEDIYSVLERNTDKTKDGIASASILNADANAISFWEQRLEKLDTTKEYLLSGYIFSDMIVSENNGAAVFVEFYDPEGNLIKTVRSDYVKGEQTDWFYFENKLTFPENCFTMVVKAGLIKAAGTAYFDGFSLTEYDEKSYTAQEGVFENIYFMGLADEDYNETVNNNGSINLSLWFVIIGIVSLVVLTGIGLTLFVLIRRRMESDNTV